MEIKNFIKVYDEVLPWEIISNVLKFANKIDFKESQIIGSGGQSTTDFNVRRTYVYALDYTSDSMTTVHWGQFFSNFLWQAITKYKNDCNILDMPIQTVNTPATLKYEQTGFYTWHVDHCKTAPRSLSCVLMLNNDYEGGELCFRNPDGSKEGIIEVKSNRLVIWPSIFLYPHTVKPVTKGTRYSMVAWAV